MISNLIANYFDNKYVGLFKDSITSVTTAGVCQHKQDVLFFKTRKKKYPDSF